MHVAAPPQVAVDDVAGVGVFGVNGFAVASFVLSLLWLFWIGSLLGTVFGFVALSQFRNAGDKKRGRGLAIAGTVLGVVGLLIFVAALVGGARRGS